jgi:hypothetical protein
MDGGLWTNNPAQVALFEVNRVLKHLKEPDQFVSVGTGMCNFEGKDEQNLTVPESPLTFRLGQNSIHQAYQYIMKHNFNGEQDFEAFLKMLNIASDDKGNNLQRYLRFNLGLGSKLPDLADVNAMNSLRETAWKHFQHHPEVQELARSLLVSSFYFELSSAPVYEDGYYICHGKILCRIPVTKAAFFELMNKMRDLSAQFIIDDRILSGKGVTALCFDYTGNFNRSVTFKVEDLDKRVDMRIMISSSLTYHISASPVAMSTLVKVQKLSWVNHRTGEHKRGVKRLRGPCESAPPCKKHCPVEAPHQKLERRPKASVGNR